MLNILFSVEGDVIFFTFNELSSDCLIQFNNQQFFANKSGSLFPVRHQEFKIHIYLLNLQN